MNDETRPQTTQAGTVSRLDARQRAMLAEMGVRVWAPRPAPVPAPFTAQQPEAAASAAVSAPRAVAGPTPATAQAAPPAAGAKAAPTAASDPAPAGAAQAASAASAGPAPARAGPPRDAVAQLDWPALQAAVAGCEACGLCRSRRNTVFGVGDPQADWMVVGEAPGENEDLQGEPFVGAAGQLLDSMLRAVGRSRQGAGPQGVYIANVLKCRPPANRNPQPAELAQCEPYLARQVALVRPRLLLAMGRFAVQALLRTDEPIGRLRGRVHRYQDVPVVVTYHPAYLLRSPVDKAKAWADLCLALDTSRAA